MNHMMDGTRDPRAAAVRRPGRGVTWGALEAGARDLAQRLRAGAMTRVALAGASSDAIMAVLLASRQAGCELLLLRSSIPARRRRLAGMERHRWPARRGSPSY
jgi:acyl-CoA synthetase (AMP-forming)/AMP-acid ligase II